MKKLVCLMIALLLVGCFLPQARADVIYEPMDDFYLSHREKCEYHARSYTAKAPNGTVTAYQSPESDKVITTLDNGSEVYISYIYTDGSGVAWGFNGNWTEEAGWIPMDYLELIYDNISFFEDHEHEFVTYEKPLDEKWKGKSVFFWAYPGSETGESVKLEDDMPFFNRMYTDPQGRAWAYCYYYFGMRDFWVCLDAPDADYETLFPRATEPAESQPDLETEPIQQTGPVEEIKPPARLNVTVVSVAIGAVVLVTAALLVLLKKMRK